MKWNLVYPASAPSCPQWHIFQDKWHWIKYCSLKQTNNYTDNNENIWQLSYDKSETGNNWKATVKNSPSIFRPFLKVLKNSYILACGFNFTQETLLWSFFSPGCSSFLRNKKRHSARKNRVFFCIKLCNISKTKQTFAEEIWDDMPKQNCMWNMERFWQSYFFRRAFWINKAGPLIW